MGWSVVTVDSNSNRLIAFEYLSGNGLEICIGDLKCSHIFAIPQVALAEVDCITIYEIQRYPDEGFLGKKFKFTLRRGRHFFFTFRLFLQYFDFGVGEEGLSMMRSPHCCEILQNGVIHL